jgi:2,3-bisphosphoglycerate-independent phosphoglycerate mutase
MSSPLPTDPHLLRPIPRPVVLCILDGWGYREESENNAIAQANLVSWRRLWASCPHALLVTSGLAVGLPEGQMGNSEVGHLTIGAGRVVMQELPKIDSAIASGALAQNEQVLALIAKAKASGGACHLMGLASDGGVHAHIDHIKALAQIVC